MDCTPVDRKCGDKMISATYKGRSKNNKQKGVLGDLFIYREERVADQLMRIASVWDPSPLMPGWCIFGLSWSAGVGSMHLGLLNSLICIVFIYWIHACSTVSFPFHSSILFAFPIRILILRRQLHWKFSFKKTNKQTNKICEKRSNPVSLSSFGTETAKGAGGIGSATRVGKETRETVSTGWISKQMIQLRKPID